MPPYFPDNPSATYAARFALLAALYGIVAWVSLSLIPPGGTGASLVWPVAAVGLAGLLFWGLDLWPALTLPIFLVLLVRGVAPATGAGVALGNTAEALLGAYILMRVQFHPLMSRLRDTLGLILASLVSTLVSSFIIAGSSAFFAGHAFNSNLWAGIWIGHAVSLLSFGPFVIRWGYRPQFTKTRWELLEGAVVFGSIAVVDFIASWTPYSMIGPIALVYVLVILLIWASLRTGPRGISLALAMTGAIAVGGVLFGYHAQAANTADTLFETQVLIGTLSLIFILFTSIVEERKEAVIALEGHVGQLEDALQKISLEDQAKSEFIAILAHELRNPLSPVLSGLEILKSSHAPAPDVLTMMGAHLNALARLLDDLLDMTRITQKKFKLEREPVMLQSVVERSLEMAGPYLAQRAHVFSLQMPEEEMWLNADPVRLAQVFVNLLNNAAKYTPPKGSISLAVVREGQEAIVRVRDNGQGIAPGRMRKIFEPFAGGAQRTSGPGGLHIGLSLARRMVELHHGSIEAKSAGADRGSEFIVRLPLPAAVQAPLIAVPKKEPRGRLSHSQASAPAGAGGMSVLVVDDNEAAAAMLGTLLRHNGHAVSIAHNGMAAIKEADQSPPQVALVDIGLPDIDGYEVAKRLRAKHGKNVSLIALTGYGQEDDKIKSREAGFDDHLVKPVSIVDVERALANLKKA